MNDDLAQQLARAEARIRALQDELNQSNQGLVALTLELEQRVDERTAELREAHAALKRSNAELRKLTRELEARVEARTAELRKANKLLQSEIDERTKAEQQLRQRGAELTALNTELESFSYSLTHDLRAPLRAIEGFSNLLADHLKPILDPTSRDFLQRIVTAAQRMDRLIQDLHTVTKFSRGPVELAPIDVERLIAGLLRERPSWQPPHARVDIEPPLPQVMAHEASLTQCVTNLIDNGLKFIPAGSTPTIRIRAQLHDHMVRLIFEDNGIGIARDNIDKLFRLFNRVNTENFEGTGIGLFIVRKAAERMGGRAGVESDLGKGSRFWIELQEAHPVQP